MTEVAIDPEALGLMRRVKEGSASENELSQLRELLGSTPGLAQALQTTATPTTAPLSPQLRSSNDKCKTEASVQISKYYLDFGTKDKKCALNKPITDKIKITNTGNSAVKLKFPESQSKPHIYQLTVTPHEVKLKKGASVEVAVEISLACTTRLKEIITMQVQGGQNHVFSLRADSVMSQILDYSELNVGSVIGSGGFGTVFKATWRGLPVAVKKMEAADGFDQEVEVHRELAHHPNVVHFVGVCLFPKVTVCEYIEGGSLDKYLNTTPKLAMRIRLKIALEIAKGMMFLHENELLHLDLKPPNFLVVSLSLSAPVAIKLADFGLSQGSSQTFKGRRVEGSFLYMAPEVFLNAQFSRAADVWSYGACLIEIITDQKPFHEYEKLPYLEMVKKRNDSEIPQVPPDCNPELAELMTSCLCVDRTKRPTFEQIVQILEKFIEQNQAYLGEAASPRPLPTRAPPSISLTSLLSQDILNTPVPSPPTPRSGAVSPRTSPSSSAPSSPFGTPPTTQSFSSGPPPLPPRTTSMLSISSSPSFLLSSTPPPVPVRTTPPSYAISSSPSSHSSAPPVPPRSASSRSIRIPTSPHNTNVHNPFPGSSPASPSFYNNTPVSPSRPMLAKTSVSTSELPISPSHASRARNGPLARSASPGSSSFISSSPLHSLASSPAAPLSTSSPSAPHHPLRKHATTTAIIPQTRDDSVDPKSYNPLVKGSSGLVRTMTEPQFKVGNAHSTEQLDATGLASAEMDDPKIESLRHLTQTNFDAAVSTLEQASRALQIIYSLKPAIEFSKQILAFKRALESASETFLSANSDVIKGFVESNPRPTALQFIYSPPPSSHFSSAESFSHVSALLAKTSIVLGQGLDLLHYCQIRLSQPANVAEILTLAKCARWIKNNAPPLGNAEESRARAVRERSPTVDSSFSSGSRFM